jgi:hypothetical protein
MATGSQRLATSTSMSWDLAIDAWMGAFGALIRDWLT